MSAVAAAIISSKYTTAAFSSSRQRQCRPVEVWLNRHVVDGEIVVADDADATDADTTDTPAHVSTRIAFLSKVVSAATSLFATPTILFSAPPSSIAAEYSSELATTRIELTVDTEYLIRVLKYFDGDMRKVLGVLVRAPQTTLEIEPPAKKRTNPNVLSPRDAILRALYSYKSPEDYATQASWLKVDEPDRGWVEFLTKKRYKIYLPSIGSDDNNKDENGMLEVTIQSTNIQLSNLEAALGVVVLSYPLAYSYYNYESFIEEKEKAAKKAQLAAKNNAVKDGAVKKDKKAQKNENAVIDSTNLENRQPVTQPVEEQSQTKIGEVSASDIDAGAKYAIDDHPGAAVPDLQLDSSIASPEQEQEQHPPNSNPLSTISETYLQNEELQYYDKVHNEDTAIEQQWLMSQTDPALGINELEQLVAVAAAAAAKTPFKDMNDYANVVEQQQKLIKMAAGPADQDVNELEQLVAAAASSQQTANTNDEAYYLNDSTLELPETVASDTVEVEDSIDFPSRQNNNRWASSLRSLVENMNPRRGGPMSNNNYLDTL